MLETLKVEFYEIQGFTLGFARVEDCYHGQK